MRQATYTQTESTEFKIVTDMAGGRLGGRDLGQNCLWTPHMHRLKAQYEFSLKSIWSLELLPSQSDAKYGEEPGAIINNGCIYHPGSTSTRHRSSNIF